MVLPITGRIDNGNGTGIRTSQGSPGSNVVQAASQRVTPPRAGNCNIINAVAGTTIGNPSKRGGISGRERGRDAQIKFRQEAVEHASTQVLLLAETTTTDMAGQRRAKASIGINK
jgi:hypothetical protein